MKKKIKYRCSIVIIHSSFDFNFFLCGIIIYLWCFDVLLLSYFVISTDHLLEISCDNQVLYSHKFLGP